MLQSIDPEKLRDKEGLRISLGRGNRIDFYGGLMMSRDGNRRDQGGGRGREYQNGGRE